MATIFKLVLIDPGSCLEKQSDNPNPTHPLKLNIPPLTLNPCDSHLTQGTTCSETSSQRETCRRRAMDDSRERQVSQALGVKNL